MPSNQEALDWLEGVNSWPGLRLALWGEAGCGKTHLLRRWAASVGGSYMTGDASPAQARAVAIDDADQRLHDEVALLHLLNRAAEDRCPVLLAAALPPARWPARIPDLASRLRAITAVRIGRPEEDLLQHLFQRYLADRQLVVPAALQDWIRLRLPRNPGILLAAATQLDALSLAAGTGVTRSLAAETVRLLAGTCLEA